MSAVMFSVTCENCKILYTVFQAVEVKGTGKDKYDGVKANPTIEHPCPRCQHLQTWMWRSGEFPFGKLVSFFLVVLTFVLPILVGFLMISAFAKIFESIEGKIIVTGIAYLVGTGVFCGMTHASLKFLSTISYSYNSRRHAPRLLVRGPFEIDVKRLVHFHGWAMRSILSSLDGHSFDTFTDLKTAIASATPNDAWVPRHSAIALGIACKRRQPKFIRVDDEVRAQRVIDAELKLMSDTFKYGSYWERALVSSSASLSTDSLVERFKILLRGLWDSDANAPLLAYIIDCGSSRKLHLLESSLEYKLARAAAERLNIFEHPGVNPENENFLTYLKNYPIIPRCILLDRSAYPADLMKEYMERLPKCAVSKSFSMMHEVSSGVQGALIEVINEYESTVKHQ